MNPAFARRKGSEPSKDDVGAFSIVCSVRAEYAGAESALACLDYSAAVGATLNSLGKRCSWRHFEQLGDGPAEYLRSRLDLLEAGRLETPLDHAQEV